MKAIVRRLLPPSVASSLDAKAEIRSLRALTPQPVDASALRSSAPPFRDLDLAADWDAVRRRLEPLGVGDKGGAVNPGDRRAIYYLVRALGARSILEIGTHLGASTAMFALALKDSGVASPKLTTVDILDVNGPRGAWARLGNAHSPKSLMRALDCDFVEFVVSPSLDFLGRCESRFDLIFLDGGHEAATVYREVPAALRLLNPGGTILLHDVYPDCEPLWSDGAVVRGPWLAIERLRREGAPIRVVPLGALPWPTKHGSNVTSLALLVRDVAASRARTNGAA